MTKSTQLKRPPQNPDQAARFLSERLRHTLALLWRGDDEIVSLGLATLPRGSRLVLQSLGAVQQTADRPDELKLTSYGQELMAACAIAGIPPRLQQKLATLEEKRAHRAVLSPDHPERR